MTDLRITNVEASYDLGFTDNSLRNAYKVTANVPLWEEPGKQVAPEALMLERALTDSPDKLTPAGNLPLSGPEEMWIRHSIHNRGVPDVHTLNQRIGNLKRVGVEIVTPTPNPRIVHAHRSIKFGEMVIEEVWKLDSVQRAYLIPTGNETGAEEQYKIYPEGVLLGVAIDPAYRSVDAAKSQLEDLLIRDLRPVKGTGL